MQFPIVPLPESLATSFSDFHTASVYTFLVVSVAPITMLILGSTSKDKGFLKFSWAILFMSLAGIFLGGYMMAAIFFAVGIWMVWRLCVAAKATFSGSPE